MSRCDASVTSNRKISELHLVFSSWVKCSKSWHLALNKVSLVFRPVCTALNLYHGTDEIGTRTHFIRAWTTYLHGPSTDKQRRPEGGGGGGATGAICPRPPDFVGAKYYKRYKIFLFYCSWGEVGDKAPKRNFTQAPQKDQGGPADKMVTVLRVPISSVPCYKLRVV